MNLTRLLAIVISVLQFTSRHAAGTKVASFDDLALVFDSTPTDTTSTISISSPHLIFPHHLTVQAATAYSIETTSGHIPAMLSGGDATRLFVLLPRCRLSLRGLVIAHGRCSEATCEGGVGGAFFVGSGSSLILTSCSLANNQANYGGAIYAASATIIVNDCTMKSNTAAAQGGAIHAAVSSIVSVTNSTLATNVANGGGFIVTLGDSVFTALDCTVTSNLAYSGGVVHAYDTSNVTMRKCVIHSNSANWGGAVYAGRDATFRSIECSMISNSASSGGVFYTRDDSFVTATDCTMASNTGEQGGALFAGGDSTVATSDCTMTYNSGYYGGLLYGGGDTTTVIMTDCTMTANSAYSGGAFHTFGKATVTASSCTMTSNSAYTGGVCHAYGDSAMTTSHCTMTSNSAVWAGAVFASDDATFAAIACTMHLNSAAGGGGALFAGSRSSVTVTDCTLSSNFADSSGGAVFVRGHPAIILTGCILTANLAFEGGAVFSTDDPTIAISGCTMTANSAHGGGAVYAEAESAFTVTDCEFVQNYADEQGGAVALESNFPSGVAFDAHACRYLGNSALFGGAFFVGNNSHSRIHASALMFNSAKTVGGAMLVLNGGTIDLLGTRLGSNVDANGSVVGAGVVAVGGSVRCQTETGYECLSVCTVCRDLYQPKDFNDNPSSTQPAAKASKGKGSMVIIVAILSLCCAFGGCIFCKFMKRDADSADEIEQNTSVRPLLAHARDDITQTAERRPLEQPGQYNAASIEMLDTSYDDGSRGHGIVPSSKENAVSSDRSSSSDSEKPDMASTQFILRSVMASSPAAIFVVDREMQIKLWSPGMSRLVPLLVTPVGGLLADLPFVTARSGLRLSSVLQQMVKVPEAPQTVQTVMLHLASRNGPVLLEMEANLLGTDDESLVVLTGCEVESELAGFIACESVPSESDQANQTSLADDSSTEAPSESARRLAHLHESAGATAVVASRVDKGQGAAKVVGRRRGIGIACYDEDGDGDDDASKDGHEASMVSSLTLPTIADRSESYPEHSESEGIGP